LTTRNYVIDGQPFEVEILERLEAHSIVRVNGKIHRVDHPSAASRHARAPVAIAAPAPARAPRPAPGEVRAPMAGRVVRLNVGSGTEVAAGDALLVLDAMKMENTIMAPRAGKIAEIAVGPGETVLQGALLLRVN
jgi:biotin carboxyl carrier protein